jgi:hypothetical protein
VTEVLNEGELHGSFHSVARPPSHQVYEVLIFETASNCGAKRKNREVSPNPTKRTGVGISDYIGRGIRWISPNKWKNSKPEKFLK